jgi:hypothetical protein
MTKNSKSIRLSIYGNSRSPRRTSKLQELHMSFCSPGTGSSWTKSMRIHADPDPDPQHCVVFCNWKASLYSMYVVHVNVWVSFPSFPNPIFFSTWIVIEREASPPGRLSPLLHQNYRRVGKRNYGQAWNSRRHSPESWNPFEEYTEKKENNVQAFTLFPAEIEWTFSPFSLM